MANFVPLINGSSYDWANITISFLGSPISQITKINYDSKQNKQDHYGWYTQPISRGYGNVTYTGSIELYYDVWRSICQASIPGFGNVNDPLLIPPFTISVNYGNFNQSSVMECRDILYFCEFLENPRTANQGDTGLKVTVPLIIGAIDSFSIA